MAFALSTVPVVAKVQHEPHWPWSLIGVVMPASTQFTEAGTSTFSKVAFGPGQLSVELGLAFVPSPRCDWISVGVQSENLLWPRT